MGFGDFITKAKDTAVSGLNAIADGAHALQEYVAASAPVKAATDAVATVKEKVSTFVSDNLGTATNVVPAVAPEKVPATTVTQSAGSYVPDTLKFAAKTIVENIDTIALAALSPTAAIGYAIAKNGSYVSQDGKLTVTKLEGKGLGAGTTTDAAYNALAEYQGVSKNDVLKSTDKGACAAVAVSSADGTGCLEFTNVYDELTGQNSPGYGLPGERKEKVVLSQEEWQFLNGSEPSGEAAVERTSGVVPTESHSYKDAQDRRVEIKAGEGQVEITRTDKSGKVETKVTANESGTTAEHNGELAARDTIKGISTVTSEQGVMRQEGDVRIIEKGDYIIKHEDGKVNWYNKKTGAIIRQLTAQGTTTQVNDQLKVQVLAPSVEVQAAARAAQDEMQGGPNDALRLIVAKDMTIAITNRIRVEALKNGNCIFRTRDGKGGAEQVFLVDTTGKLLSLVDGKFVEADAATRAAWGVFKKEVEEIPGTTIDAATGCVRLQGLTIDHAQVRYGDQTLQSVEVKRDSEGTPTVVDAHGSTTIAGEKIVIADKALGTTEWTPGTGKLETPDYVVTPEVIENKQTGTTINNVGDIEMDNGEGPTLKHDGAVKFDEETEIDNRGIVVSGYWHASGGYGGGYISAAAPGGSFEKSMQSVIASANKDAEAVLKKANARVITTSDIDSLGSASSSISSMIGIFAQAGNSAMVAMLTHALGKLAEARDSGSRVLAEKSADLTSRESIARPHVLLTIARAA